MLGCVATTDELISPIMERANTPANSNLGR
jgi:hypothetical protein